jgi:hypothetical protein
MASKYQQRIPHIFSKATAESRLTNYSASSSIKFTSCSESLEPITTSQQQNLSRFDEFTSMASVLDLGRNAFDALQLLQFARGIVASLHLDLNLNIVALDANYHDLAQQFLQLRGQANSFQNRTFGFEHSFSALPQRFMASDVA